MATEYSLTFVNNSTNNWSFCCYQHDPDIGAHDVMSLAWFAFPTAPTTAVSFSWETDYQFVWSQTGALRTGARFIASQRWDADLKMRNVIDFTREPNDAFNFRNPRAAVDHEGTFFIQQDRFIPEHIAAVGINMGIKDAPPGSAGTGTFVVPAGPRLSASFTPHPRYWVTFGNYVPGQVLDMQKITNTAKVEFPPNVYDMIATLNEGNEWEVKPAITSPKNLTVA